MRRSCLQIAAWQKLGMTMVLGALVAGSVVAPAAAKTCKDPLTVTSRSTIKTSEAARTKRATDNAEKKWSKEVRAKYGLQFYFWATRTRKRSSAVRHRNRASAPQPLRRAVCREQAHRTLRPEPPPWMKSPSILQ